MTNMNWGEWLDGRVWLLVGGEDFECKRETFRNAARAAAVKRGLKFTARAVGDADLAIRASRPE